MTSDGASSIRDSCEVRKQIRTQMKSRRYNGSSTPSIRSRRYSETRSHLQGAL